MTSLRPDLFLGFVRDQFLIFVRSGVAAILAVTLIALPQAHADQHEDVFADREARAIEQIVIDLLTENPQIVIDAIQAYQDLQEQAEAELARLAIAEHRDQLLTDPASPVGGNPDGDVTVVEFFDYQCSYCKRAAPDVVSLLKNDGNIRLVYKEWPILGPDSVFAARAALASRAQGKYLEFHEAVMNQRQVSEASVIRAAEELGLDIDRLRADMEAPEVSDHLDATMQLAQALGINGTPSFVFGDQLVPGVASLDQMQALVDAARAQAASR